MLRSPRRSPKLKRQGKLHALRRVSALGRTTYEIPGFESDNTVERFYGEYFFPPRVIWRIVRKAMFDGDERRRLTKQAREYMAQRSKRRKFVAEQKAAKPAPLPANSGD